MHACDKFIFLHLHKSGGTFVNQLMMTCLPGARKLGYHLPASEIPADFHHLPVLGTVRNPLAYYVSWYHFQLQLGPARRNILFELCSDGGQADFAQTVAPLVTLESRPALIDALIAALPDNFTGSGLNLTKRCIAQIRGSRQGFYSFLRDRMYRGASNITILRAEDLRTALHDYLADRYPEEESWRAFLNYAPNMNRSEHDVPDRYYSDGLRQLMVELDRPVFDAHGYDTRRVATASR